MAYWFGRFLNAVFGWKVEGEIPPGVRKAVFIAAPHTSNWDLVHMLSIAFVLRVRLGWVGKHTMFEVPVLGWLLKRLGGVPVIRGQKRNQVDQLADVFGASESLFLALAPSGTRSLRDHWKSGFYHVAVAAEVPILCGYLDYTRKAGGIGPTLHPDGDLFADMDHLREFYEPIQGRRPELKSTIVLKEELEKS